jgi:hypothetical protein
MKHRLLALLLLGSTLAWSGLLGADAAQLSTRFAMGKDGGLIFRSSPRIALQVQAEAGNAVRLDFSTQQAFPAAQLWEILDGEAQGADWLEIIPGVAVPEAIARLRDARADQEWVLADATGLRCLAQLFRVGEGHTLRIRTISLLKDLPTVPLEMNLSAEAFPEFVGELEAECLVTGQARCLLSHREEPGIEVELRSGGVRFQYRAGKSEEPLLVPTGLAKQSEAEQRDWIEALRLLLRHEYDLGVRAFLLTTPGLFNRQPWQWFLESDACLPADAEIRAWIAAGALPGEIPLCRRKVGTRNFLLTMTSSGLYHLEVR